MGVLVSPRRHIHDDRDVFYPTRDDEPLAETILHGNAILATVTALRHYLQETAQERSPVVLCNPLATQERDRREKKALYERLGVNEYWLFDPKGEWIAEKLLGYRLQPVADPVYEPIPDGRSETLGLQLVVEGPSLGLYRLDTGEKLLDPTALHEALKQEKVRAEQERLRAEQERERGDRLAQELAALRQQLGGNN